MNRDESTWLEPGEQVAVTVRGVTLTEVHPVAVLTGDHEVTQALKREGWAPDGDGWWALPEEPTQTAFAEACRTAPGLMVLVVFLFVIAVGVATAYGSPALGALWAIHNTNSWWREVRQ